MGVRTWGVVMTAMLATITACADPGPTGPRDVLTSQERQALTSQPVGPAVLVAVVDSGIDADHPALRDRVTGSWRAPGLAPGIGSHGTQVAGVVAGRSVPGWSGGLAVGAPLLDVQVLDRDGQGSAEDLAAGLRYAHAVGADLVLTSLALSWDAPDVRAAVLALRRDGVLLVAAAGNGFGDPPAFPADYPEVLGVAALDASGRRQQLSGWAAADAVAPGEAVLAPVPGGGYEAMSGTSAAAAVAAGLLAACGGPGRWPDPAPAAPWTNGSVEDAGRARPRLTCPGHNDEGGR
jgi:thermitase